MREVEEINQSDGQTAAPPASVPVRPIRARYDDQTITVYQAYSNQIADRALAAGRFVSPFKRDRMTWIKPSFLWMMYRCGWATKSGQERVLAIDLSREGFEWALAQSCPSHYRPDVDASERAWQARKAASPVRIQWDPERSLALGQLPYRSIQIGLSGQAVELYVTRWISRIVDITEQAQALHELVRAGDETAARAQLPEEQPYPLTEALKSVIGAS